jgi:hypothetical protein
MLGARCGNPCNLPRQEVCARLRHRPMISNVSRSGVQVGLCLRSDSGAYVMMDVGKLSRMFQTGFAGAIRAAPPPWPRVLAVHAATAIDAGAR